MDEATSALDNQTEQAVMDAIEKLGSNLTVFIIAHRLTTLKDCNQIVNISKNNLQITNYENIIKSNEDNII